MPRLAVAQHLVDAKFVDDAQALGADAEPDPASLRFDPEAVILEVGKNLRRVRCWHERRYAREGRFP